MLPKILAVDCKIPLKAVLKVVENFTHNDRQKTPESKRLYVSLKSALVYFT